MLFTETVFPPSRTVILQVFISRVYMASFLNNSFSSLILLENLI